MGILKMKFEYFDRFGTKKQFILKIVRDNKQLFIKSDINICDFSVKDKMFKLHLKNETPDDDGYLEYYWKGLFDPGKERLQDLITERWDDEKFKQNIIEWFKIFKIEYINDEQ